MTAGLYASRSRLKTRLIEKLSPGGQVLLTDWVDNYPGFPDGISGFELVDRMRQQAERFGLDIVSAEVTSLETVGDSIRINLDQGSLTAKAVIITTGAQPIKLGVPGEEEYGGKGVSYCATCDGPFYRDEIVGVVGGGDTAVEEAIYLTRFASEVHLFHRRDQLRAAGILKEKVAAEPKIKIHWSTSVTRIAADDRGLVNRFYYRDLKTGEDFELGATGIFIFVGQRPNTEFLSGFVELSDRGFIIADGRMATSRPGVFAAGDVRLKDLRQIATAVGEGATAAYSAEKYLEETFGWSV